MRRSLFFFWITSFAVCASCLGASSTNGPANYRGAGVGAAFGIAAAGVNRAITGDCWASCLPGSQCNHKSGLCERIPRLEDIPAPYPTVPRAAAEEPPFEPQPASLDLDAGADAADSGDAAADR